MPNNMLTTTDNPFNPHTQFDQWYNYDEQSGYHTTSFIARLLRPAPSLTDGEEELHYDLVIEEIARENVLGIYRLVPEPSDSADELVET